MSKSPTEQGRFPHRVWVLPEEAPHIVQLFCIKDGSHDSAESQGWIPYVPEASLSLAVAKALASAFEEAIDLACKYGHPESVQAMRAKVQSAREKPTAKGGEGA